MTSVHTNVSPAVHMPCTVLWPPCGNGVLASSLLSVCNSFPDQCLLLGETPPRRAIAGLDSCMDTCTVHGQQVWRGQLGLECGTQNHTLGLTGPLSQMRLLRASLTHSWLCSDLETDIVPFFGDIPMYEKPHFLSPRDPPGWPSAATLRLSRLEHPGSALLSLTS